MSWRSGSEGNVLCDKFRFVDWNHLAHDYPISYTNYPSRTRITYLVHDYPHLAHDFRVGRDGLFAVIG